VLIKENERLRRKLATAQTIIDVQKNSVPYSGSPRPRTWRRHPDERPPYLGASHRTRPCVRGLTHQPGRDLSPRCPGVGKGDRLLFQSQGSIY
jgi:hypothetical protein